MQQIDEMIGYKALVDGAAFVPTQSGYIQLAGADRIDFLQRQTTNDVRRLSAEHAVLTVLTSPTARIIDVLWLVADGESIVILTAPQRGRATASFLGGKIFFMDKVTVQELSGDYAQFDLDGPQLGEALAKIGVSLPAVDAVWRGEINGVAVRMIGRDGAAGSGARLIVPTGDVETVEKAMETGGIVRASAEAYETRRIEAGIAGINEMTEEFTPLEVRLNHAISDSKGCYTGQEIIARQITYDKVTRSLVGLKLDALVRAGDEISVDGRNVGVVTSAAESPRYGSIALGVVKRPYFEVGGEVTVGEVTGRIVTLPF